MASSLWPLGPSDSRSCPAPPLIEWMTPMNHWTSSFPLIHIYWTAANLSCTFLLLGLGDNSGHQTDRLGSSLVEFSTRHVMSRLSLAAAAGGDGGVSGAASPLSCTLVDDGGSSGSGGAGLIVPPPISFDHSNCTSWLAPCTVNVTLPVPKLIDAHFCSFGYTFILEAITGYLIAVIAFLCFAALSWYSRKHFHRKLLFFLLFVIGAQRGIFGHLASNRIATVDTYFDTANIMGWFFDYTIPMNMFGDILTAYVDLLLTFFWLQFVAPRWSRSHWGTFTPIAISIVSLVLGCVTFAVDYHELNDLNDYNGGNVYARSVAYISAVMLLSSILHTVVVGMLFQQMYRHAAYLENLSKKLQRNMIVVGVIGFLSVACGIMRGVVLLGHVAQVPAFLDGAFSFDNAVFTTVYLLLFMNVPCLVICISFFILSWGLMTSTGADGLYDDSDGETTYSIISDADGTRISFLGDVTRSGPLFTPTVSSDFRPTNNDFSNNETSPRLTGSASRRLASTSAMFVGSGPQNRSGGLSKSNRALNNVNGSLESFGATSAVVPSGDLIKGTPSGDSK